MNWTKILQIKLKKEINQQKEDLKMMETEMNQQKLSMLIKFDKIKFLEDFYNMSRINRNKENECIKLDVDINQ